MPVPMNFGDDRLPLRFWNKVVPCPMSGCWLWTGCLTSAGYGLIAFGPHRDSPPTYTHRLAYSIAHGSMPEGDTDHLCRVTNCCNPLHLEDVSHRENCLRGVGPIVDKAKQTHCRRGHEFNDMNTGRSTEFGRHCRRCAALHQRERNDRLREPNTPKAWRGIHKCSVCGETAHNKLSHRPAFS